MLLKSLRVYKYKKAENFQLKHIIIIKELQYITTENKRTSKVCLLKKIEKSPLIKKKYLKCLFNIYFIKETFR